MERDTESKIQKSKNFIVSYVQESFEELRKVTWPTKNQAVKLTFLVLGICLVTAVFIGAIDFVFSYGHQQLLKYAPASTTATSASPNIVHTGVTSTPVQINPSAVTTTPVATGSKKPGLIVKPLSPNAVVGAPTPTTTGGVKTK